MLRKALATIAAATILVTAFAVAPADAKKGKKGNRDRQETTTVAPFLRQAHDREDSNLRVRYDAVRQ